MLYSTKDTEFMTKFQIYIPFSVAIMYNNAMKLETVVKNRLN